MVLQCEVQLEKHAAASKSCIFSKTYKNATICLENDDDGHQYIALQLTKSERKRFPFDRSVELLFRFIHEGKLSIIFPALNTSVYLRHGSPSDLKLLLSALKGDRPPSSDPSDRLGALSLQSTIPVSTQAQTTSQQKENTVPLSTHYPHTPAKMTNVPTTLPVMVSPMAVTPANSRWRTPLTTPSPANANKKKGKLEVKSPLSKLPAGTDCRIPIRTTYAQSSTNHNPPSVTTINEDVALKKVLFENKPKAVQLTAEQQHIIALVKQGRSVFFTGSAGTGKSYLLKEILNVLPKQQTYVTATTGVAASLISGCTIHSFAGFSEITTDNLSQMASMIARHPRKALPWYSCRVLIIDEISMMDGRYFDALECVARTVKQKKAPFGGIQLIVTGDFHQLPPVDRAATTKMKSLFAFQASTWKQCLQHEIELSQIFRQSDAGFIELLRELRLGELSSESLDKLRQSRHHSIEANTGLRVATRLCTHNDLVEHINTQEMEKLTTESVLFNAVDHFPSSVNSKTPNVQPSDLRGSLQRQLDSLCPAKPVIQLKINAPVLLLRNLNVSLGLVNGAQGTVVRFHRQQGNVFPVIRFLHRGEHCIVPDTWQYTLQSHVVTRKQLPLGIAYAISIHKSQGMTLDAVEVSLGRMFAAGQAYVALSRARTWSGVRVTDFDPDLLKRVNLDVKSYYDDLKTKENKLVSAH